MAGKDLVTSAPTLPGLLPEKPIADLLATFDVDVDANFKLVANRLPTPVQRQMLENRRAELARVLAPAERSGQQQVEMIRIIALWLAGYPRLAHADNAGMAKGYADHLKALPLFAVLRAIESIKNRTARRYDRSVKAEVPFDPDEVPSSSRVYDLAKKEMARADAEAFKIDKVLAARGIKDGAEPVDPAQRQKIGNMMRELAAGMRSGSASSPEFRAEMEEEAARRSIAQERAIAQANLHRDRAILAEYERLGLEPQYAEPGVLVSPELAKHRAPKKGRGKR